MKWEYRAIEAVKEVILVDLLNEQGEIEWEFVWADLDKNIFIFKRPKREMTQEAKAAIEGYVSGGGKIG